MSGALITALVPVKHYRPAYLHEAIASLLAQTSPGWRALIVHGAGMRSQLQAELAEPLRDPRIELIEQRGRQLAGALNTGMRAADSEFAAILLADDLWASEAIEVLERNIADAPEVDFFHSARRIIDDDGNPVSSVHPAVAEVRSEMFVEQGPVKHLLCWRRQLALSIGGIDESLNSVGVDDYDFPWSMFEAGARFRAIQQCLYIYRDHRSGHRLTTHLPLSHHLSETRRILRKHGVPEELIRARLDAARGTYLRQCLYPSALHAFLARALRRDPARGWRDTYV